MKDKLLQIRVDDDFLFKLEYLQEINSYKSIAETVRKIMEKEYKKETYEKVAEFNKKMIKCELTEQLEKCKSGMFCDECMLDKASKARWDCEAQDNMIDKAIALLKGN